ncbi:hypothetical protein GALMADRAFT_137661 [Galerina marginata CBS 339.88]|uniref:C2H2-type domain-containing protein n=1 Tax=Galerina marginata (strain CBS 339.88) TaxID=685588 RepID=A0A067TI23_GALM3|nr:hypothetical protein GALMADRAFT_137661 [Galerina marginata CBS 339.88]
MSNIVADVTFDLFGEAKTSATHLSDGPDAYFFASRRPSYDYSIADLDISLSPGLLFDFNDTLSEISESSGSTSSAEFSSAESTSDSDDSIFDPASPSPSEDQSLEPNVICENTFDSVGIVESRNPIEVYLHSFYDKNGYYPKLGVFDDYQSETETEDVDEDQDADGEMDDGNYTLASYTPSSLLTASRTSSPSPSDVPASSVGVDQSDDSASICDNSDDDNDDNYDDQPYNPSPRRASSLPIASSAHALSSSARAKHSSHSAASSPKRKFNALDADEEENDGDNKPYKTLRDSAHRLVYQCRICPSFRTHASGDMNRHLESLIHMPPSHYCYIPGCDKSFTRKDALKRHVIGVHGAGKSGKGAKKLKTPVHL